MANCKFCDRDDFYPLGCRDYDFGILGEMELMSVLYSDEKIIKTSLGDDLDNELNIKINYCPICGRDLRNESEDK